MTNVGINYINDMNNLVHHNPITLKPELNKYSNLQIQETNNLKIVLGPRFSGTLIFFYCSLCILYI